MGHRIGPHCTSPVWDGPSQAGGEQTGLESDMSALKWHGLVAMLATSCPPYLICTPDGLQSVPSPQTSDYANISISCTYAWDNPEDGV